jgi:LPXTG-site transpeptidase (sortase) family protein
VVEKKLLYKISAAISGISGVVILLGVILPVVGYTSFSRQEYPTLLNPEVAGVSTSLLPKETDDTKASNWFVGGARKDDFASENVLFYTISIPKLKIDGATVAIGGEDLSKNLVQYPGTALPGKRGNSVIFGHSILPIFYNPKNYISIFSTLPTLKKGDEIDVDYDGMLYKYRVEAMFEVLPTDIQVLAQDETDSFLTLVTCVPPGDPRDPKRLIVRARVVPPDTYENLGN